MSTLKIKRENGKIFCPLAEQAKKEFEEAVFGETQKITN